MLNNEGALVWMGLSYPYNPATGEPWTDEAVAAFVATHTPPPPPPEPPAPHQPNRINKADFGRLFTAQQESRINKWEKIVKSLPPEEYDLPASGLILQVERVLKAFERPLEFIELNHPDTILAIELLAYAGVFGEDDTIAAAEVARVLSGVLPS